MAMIDLLKPTAGTWRVIGARWLLYMLAMLPGTLSLSRHLNETIGTRSWLQELQPPLDTLSLKFVMAQLSDGVGLLMAGVFVIWLLQLVWLGGSMRVLDPRAPGVQTKVFANGWQYLARFLRIAIFALIATLVLQFLISKIFGALSARAETQPWSVYDAYIGLNQWRVFVMFVALNLVGLIGFWARTIAVVDERTDTRRLLWPAVKQLLHKPVAAFAAQFLLVCAVLAIQATALWCWRQSASGSLWFGGWALLQLATAYVWQLRIRWAMQIAT